MDSVQTVSTLPPNPVPGPSRLPINQQVIFDFTKRKRWADLLVSELTEAIMFVLSATGQVWFCSAAVEDLLGWKDEEIIDGDLTEVMNEEDRAAFQKQFKESVRTRTDLLSYVRLQCKTDNDLYPSIPIPLQSSSGSGPTEYTQVASRRAAPKEVLFEIKGYAHYVESSEPESPSDHIFSGSGNLGGSSTIDPGTGEVFKCFFAMARPYPSRNTAMLNTFLELKIENERLQQRLKAVRARLESQNSQSTQADSHQHQPHLYRTPSYPYAYADQSSQLSYDSGIGYTHEDRSNNPSTSVASNKSRASAGQEDADEYGGPRKKSKRSLGPDQHVCVTCGRTDSPEWRKGPLGPKTLCNACGLRWAKTVRREPTVTAAIEPSADSPADGGGMPGARPSQLPDMNRGGYSY